MIKRIILSIIALFALVSIAGASSLSVGSITYGNSVLKDESFTVSTSIEASSVSSTITVTVTLTDNTNAVTITNAQKTLTFTADGTQNVQWSVKANNPGVYTNPFTITATASDGGGDTNTATTSLAIKDRPVLEVNVSQNTSTVLPNGYVRLEYVIKNIASSDAASATDIVSLLTVPNGWIIVTSNQYNISSLPAGGTQTSGYFIVKAPDAVSASISSTSALAMTVTSAQGDSISKGWTVTVSSGSGGSNDGGDSGSGDSGSGGSSGNSGGSSGGNSGGNSGSNSGGGSSGGSSGGGGGGGGPSGEKYENIEMKENYDLQIFKDKITSYRFTGKNNPVLFVNITGGISAGEINTAVEVLRGISSFVKNPAPGIIYKNINIWVGTTGFAVPKNIKEAMIRFRVENSWLNNNSAAGGDIRVFRWDGNQWVQLETTKTNNDDTYTYYEAKTSAFSPFTITVLKNSETPAAMPEITVTDTAVEATETSTPEAAPTKKSISGFEVILAVTMLLAVYVLGRRR